jgi:tight adherence protein C
MVVYFFASRVSIEKSPGKRVREMVGSSARSFFDVGGTKFAGKMKLNVLDTWKEGLFWAQLDDNFKSWTVGGMFMRGLVAALFLSALIIFLKLPFFAWLLVIMSVFMPYMLVKGKGDEVMKRVKRLLPETATVIAAEMDAGATAGQAVERAGELPGPLGKVINLSVSKARQSEKAMFSRGANKGILMEELNRHGMPELSRFAMQLDRVAAKGVDAPRIMVEIAKGLAREYKSQVQTVAANMDTELLVPMTLFFFLPFIISILMPVLVSFKTMF